MGSEKYNSVKNRIDDIVRLKKEGVTNKDIGKFLNVSFETVRSAYKSFLAKQGMEPKLKVDKSIFAGTRISS